MQKIPNNLRKLKQYRTPKTCTADCLGFRGKWHSPWMGSLLFRDVWANSMACSASGVDVVSVRKNHGTINRITNHMARKNEAEFSCDWRPMFWMMPRALSRKFYGHLFFEHLIEYLRACFFNVLRISPGSPKPTQTITRVGFTGSDFPAPSCSSAGSPSAHELYCPKQPKPNLEAWSHCPNQA